MDAEGTLPIVSYLLQHTLRLLCAESEWAYAVFWRISPRNYPPPRWDTESSILDRSRGNKRNWILVWEDGYCDFFGCARAASEAKVSNSNDGSEIPGCKFLQPELFFKMSHEIYNYGEGLMGKVAADTSHRWVYKEPLEPELHYPPSWQGTLDPHPRTWEAQFMCGIKTIAIVGVKEGLIQLGSLKKTMEDLNFVLFLQRKFNYLQSIPGVYATHALLQPLDSAARRTSSSNGIVESSSNQARWPVKEERDQNQRMGLKRPSVGIGGMSLSSQACPAFAGLSQLPAEQSCSSEGIADYCPSTPSSYKAPHNLVPSQFVIPSMSSLQALLSKLPSVTPSPSPSCYPPTCFRSAISPEATTPYLKDPSPFPSVSRDAEDMIPRHVVAVADNIAAGTSIASESQVKNKARSTKQRLNQLQYGDSLSTYPNCYQSRADAGSLAQGFVEPFQEAAFEVGVYGDLKGNATYATFLREMIN